MTELHQPNWSLPQAYFITFSTYGARLHGDARGTVDSDHNRYGAERVSASTRRVLESRERMKDPTVLMTAESAGLVERTISEVCRHRNWRLYAVNARTNHVHIVVSAKYSPERHMNDFKAWATRRLREHNFVGSAQTVWTEHGSTPYLWSDDQLMAAVDYVKNWQGGPLQASWEEYWVATQARLKEGGR